jgi:hypothetical protein
MKLLVSWIRELGRYVSREFYYTMGELLECHGWRHVEPWVLAQSPKSVRETLIEQAGGIPDVILFWETYEHLNLLEPRLRDLGCRIALFVDDLHVLGNPAVRRPPKARALGLCDVVLASYGYAFDRHYPELAGKRVEWIPHGASPDFCLPLEPAPRKAVLLSGFVSANYPLRLRLKQLYDEGRPGIEFLPHPGYGENFNYNSDARIGTGYARAIHQCLAGFTDAAVFGYVVAKHFEIPATGALLLAGDTVRQPLAELGFRSGRDYLAVSEDNLEEQLEYVLDDRNRGRIDEIRREGQKLVLAGHTTRDRAVQIDRIGEAMIAPRRASVF